MNQEIPVPFSSLNVATTIIDKEILIANGDALERITIEDFSAYFQMFTKIAIPILPSDAAPTLPGLYKPRIYSPSPGTNYPNIGNLKAVEGYETLFYYNGTSWVDVANKMPEAVISVNGKIEENNPDAVSGNEVYKKVITGVIITSYNTWENGYYYTDGNPSTGNTYNMQRTPKSPLKKGEKLKLGVNTFNVSGGSAAILNIYNLDGSFKANILKHSDYLNQFKEYVYTATEDILYSVTDFSSATFGQRYVKVESVAEKALDPMNNRVKVLETNQNQILNGSTELIPEQIIPINVSSYYYSHNGQVAPTAYGHKRTGLTLLEKGQTVSYGVNGYTQIGSVAVLNTYNLDGTFKANIRKLDSGTIGKFFTGTYTASEKEYFGISDYADGAYGTAFVKILQSEPFNYHKGINYLLDKDKSNDTKFSALSPSDIQADRMYQRGLAKVNLSVTKDILLIIDGQSNAQGRNPKETFPAQYLNSQGEVKGILMWNDQIKAFAPFKFGLGGNTGDGPPGEKSELEWYGFDIIAAAMLAEYTGKTIYIVKRAQGGTAIDITGTNGGGYWTPITEDIVTGKKLIEELKIKVLNAMAANPNLEPKAILSHQGEGDSTALAKVKYYQNKKNVIRYERGIVANPKLPYIFGTIVPNSAGFTTEVDNAFHQIDTEDKFAYLVNMSDGNLFDSYHFDPASTLSFAQRVFNILKTLV